MLSLVTSIPRYKQYYLLHVNPTPDQLFAAIIRQHEMTIRSKETPSFSSGHAAYSNIEYSDEDHEHDGYC